MVFCSPYLLLMPVTLFLPQMAVYMKVSVQLHLGGSGSFPGGGGRGHKGSRPGGTALGASPSAPSPLPLRRVSLHPQSRPAMAHAQGLQVRIESPLLSLQLSLQTVRPPSHPGIRPPTAQRANDSNDSPCYHENHLIRRKLPPREFTRRLCPPRPPGALHQHHRQQRDAQCWLAG